MLISLTGFISCGKDTVANYFQNQYNFKKMSFASALKDVLCNIFNWDRNKIEGLTIEDREWRNTIDTWWAERLNIPNLTPRFAMQYIGTDIFRDKFHNDIWIANVENKIQNSNENIVITDCRFPNELTMIRRNNGIPIRIKRGPLPTWYGDALAMNLSQYHADKESKKQKLNKLNIHESETAWIGSRFDQILLNNGSINELYSQIDKFMKQ